MATTWITGGKGFIGRYLAKYVAQQGQRVFGIGHGLWPLEAAAKGSYSYWCNGEIESANLSHLAGVSGLPDTIYHLAGGSSVGTSFQNPQEDFRRTVETTARLLEWVRLDANGTKVVVVSSAAVYGAKHFGKIAENAPISPYSPYGFHKSMMESLCRSYGETLGLQIALVRLFSVYGAGLKKQLIWDICCKLISSTKGSIQLGGAGTEVRDWLHVSDAAKLLWLARTECSVGANAINGGTGIGTSIRDVADLICRAWDASPAIEFSGTVRKGDPSSLIADTTKVSRLGFQPAITLEQGIFETVDWFKKNQG